MSSNTLFAGIVESLWSSLGDCLLQAKSVVKSQSDQLRLGDWMTRAQQVNASPIAVELGSFKDCTSKEVEVM